MSTSSSTKCPLSALSSLAGKSKHKATGISATSQRRHDSIPHTLRPGLKRGHSPALAQKVLLSRLEPCVVRGFSLYAGSLAGRISFFLAMICPLPLKCGTTGAVPNPSSTIPPMGTTGMGSGVGESERKKWSTKQEKARKKHKG